MLSLSRRRFSAGALTEMAVFAACCTITMLLAVNLHLGPYGVATTTAMVPAVQFALIMTALGVVFSLFRVGEPKSLTVVFLRTAVVLAVGFPIAYALFGYDAAGQRRTTGAGYRVPVCARRCRTDTYGSVRGARHRRRFAESSDCWHGR